MQLNRVSLERKRSDCSALPKGWQREELQRRSGITPKRSDVCYYSNSLVPPIRQTASIFKQPVTVVRSSSEGIVKLDLKSTTKDKPKQLFWEKRLESLQACTASGEDLKPVSLPNNLTAVGPNVSDQTALQSLSTALHIHNVGVLGQTTPKTELNENTLIFMNPEQPLVQAAVISEEDIRKQEDRVNLARRKLQEALKT